MFRYEKLADVPDLKRAKPGDAAWDLVNAGPAISTAGGVVIPTGIAVQIPDGWFGLVSLRSKFGVNHNLRCHIGIIDSGYRGEIKVHVDGDMVIQAGERFAQLTLIPCYHLEPELVQELAVSERGTGGFGSTGS